jgi:UDP-3-O-[3-hydroxymyristoyl] glucosamine N-acyltransferase
LLKAFYGRPVDVQVRGDSIIHGTVLIDPFVRIGSFGFGFETEDDTTTKPTYKIPLIRKKHDYPVVINRNVEIGSFTTVDAGSWRKTIIGEGTKIDSHVKIAHNVQIGKSCLIVAGAVIGGSCTIGDNVFIGINASIKQRIKIGDNAIIGMGAVVIKDVPANATVKGNPAT